MSAALVATLALGAQAQILINGGFEVDDVRGGGGVAPWSGTGESYLHADAPKPNRDTLGVAFGYYTPRDLNNEALFRQMTTELYEAGKQYTFSSWAIGGGDNLGTAIYQLGYMDGAGFVALATQTYNMTATEWLPYAGVTLAIDANSAGLGKALTVQFGPGSAAPSGSDLSDVWVDQAKVEVVPEPATMIALGAGLLGLARRRRR